MAAVRSFVAVRLPEDVRAALAAEIARLRPAGREVAWVAAENLHVTLRFLGGVEEDRLEAVGAALAAVAAGAAGFEVEVRGLGAFPTPSRPRVLWAGLAGGAPALAELAGRVEEALAGLGFPREERPFAGHVTLGRVREPRRDPRLEQALAAGAGRPFGRLPVDRVALMRSDLSPRGARYTVLGAWPLG